MNMIASTAAILSTATSAAAQPEPVLAAMPAPSDAELLALEEQLVEAQRRVEETCKVVGDLEDFPRRGPKPEELLWRESDTELGLSDPINRPARGEARAYDTPADICRMRAEKWWRVSRQTDGDKVIITTWLEAPSAEARARADEIIWAFDKWRGKSKPKRGIKKAQRQFNKACDHASHVMDQIAATPAKTLEGMKAKIRCLMVYDHVQALDKISICEGSSEDISISIFRDVMQLGVGTASA